MIVHNLRVDQTIVVFTQRTAVTGNTLSCLLFCFSRARCFQLWPFAATSRRGWPAATRAARLHCGRSRPSRCWLCCRARTDKAATHRPPLERAPTRATPLAQSSVGAALCVTSVDPTCFLVENDDDDDDKDDVRMVDNFDTVSGQFSRSHFCCVLSDDSTLKTSIFCYSIDDTSCTDNTTPILFASIFFAILFFQQS